MSRQKRGKIFLSEVWIKKAEGCDKSSTQEKSICLGLFVSFGHFSDGHLTESLGVFPYDWLSIEQLTACA